METKELQGRDYPEIHGMNFMIWRQAKYKYTRFKY